VSNMSCSENT